MFTSRSTWIVAFECGHKLETNWSGDGDEDTYRSTNEWTEWPYLDGHWSWCGVCRSSCWLCSWHGTRICPHRRNRWRSAQSARNVFCGVSGRERIRESLETDALDRFIYRDYLLVMLELINIALAIYRLIVLEPGHLRRRSTLHLADDAHLLAVIHRCVARRRADRRDRCVLCCKMPKKENNMIKTQD